MQLVLTHAYYSEVSVAKFIELINESNNVVIDDSFNVPMLLSKGSVSTQTSNYIPKYDSDNSEFYFNYARFDWQGIYVVNAWVNPAEIPFGANVNASMTPAAIQSRLDEVSQDMFVAVRSGIEGYGAIGKVSFDYVTATQLYRLIVKCESDLQGNTVGYALYTHTPLKPISPTVAVFAEDGSLKYDVRRPPMIFLGSLYGNLNLRQDVAGMFNFNLPNGINSNDVYITNKSGAPFYSAYKIHSGGVNFASTPFKTVLTFPSTTMATATIRRVKSVSGNNGPTYYGGFSENLIYCPYPIGNYL